MENISTFIRTIYEWHAPTYYDYISDYKFLYEKNGTYFIVKSAKFSIRYQREDPNSVKIPQNNIDSELGIGTNEEGDKELNDGIFKNKVFDNPKPISLIKYLINMV